MNFDDFKALLEADRSIRRFQFDKKISEEQLLRLVDLTRYCASGRNLQPLRYRVVFGDEECAEVYKLLAWAGYYQDWDGPVPDERPTAYMVQCLDTTLTNNPLCDEGLQLQAITLGARAMGIGCCIIRSFNREKLSEVIALPESMSPGYVIAMGYPAERAEVVPMPRSGDIRYYRDGDDTQCVPKRSLDDILIK